MGVGTGLSMNDGKDFRLRAERAERTLDAVHEPILLVDPASRLVHANRAGEELLSAARGLLRRHARVVCESPDDTRRLHRAIGRVEQDTSGPVAFVAVSRIASVRPLAVVVSDLSTNTRTTLPSAEREPRTVLLRIHDPDRVDQLDGRRLREQFGLTAAEARLASALMARQSLREYALHRGLKLSTVRSALRAILSKTGCRRQGELVLVLKGWAAFAALLLE